MHGLYLWPAPIPVYDCVHRACWCQHNSRPTRGSSSSTRRRLSCLSRWVCIVLLWPCLRGSAIFQMISWFSKCVALHHCHVINAQKLSNVALKSHDKLKTGNVIGLPIFWKMLTQHNKSTASSKDTRPSLRQSPVGATSEGLHRRLAGGGWWNEPNETCHVGE